MDGSNNKETKTNNTKDNYINIQVVTRNATASQ